MYVCKSGVEVSESRFCEFCRDEIAEGVAEVDALLRLLLVEGLFGFPFNDFLDGSRGGTLRYIRLGPAAGGGGGGIGSGVGVAVSDVSSSRKSSTGDVVSEEWGGELGALDSSSSSSSPSDSVIVW